MDSMVKREAQYFEGGWTERFFEFMDTGLVESYDYEYGENNFKDIPKFVEVLYNVQTVVKELMIDYFTYRIYKEITSDVQIIYVDFDTAYLTNKEFQEKILQDVIYKYPNELIITKFSETELKSHLWTYGDEIESEIEEQFYFLNSLGFVDPRIRSDIKEEFMMVYAGNVTGYEYLKTLGVSDGVKHPKETNTDFVDSEIIDDEFEGESDNAENLWGLEDLAEFGAFTDEGIYPKYYSDLDYDVYDEFGEFKKRCGKRYEKRDERDTFFNGIEPPFD